MRYLDISLPAPAENIALDEALLDQAETDGPQCEVLRLWESDRTLAVVGRGSRIADEIDLVACGRDAVPVLRRTSGGAAIVSGPGCLMYAVVLSYELRPALRWLDAAHRFVLETLIAALAPLAGEVRRRGTSDLVLADAERGELKFSGNSMRAKRSHFLYHGTLLYDFPLAAISRYLRQPPRQPEYRAGRAHSQFVTNLPSDPQQLRAALVAAWQAETRLSHWPAERVAELVTQKYSRDDWNYRH